MQKKHELLLGVVDPLYLSDEKESADDKTLRNAVTVEMKCGEVVLWINFLPI